MTTQNENKSLIGQLQDKVKGTDWIDVLATSLVWMKRHKVITAVAVLLLIVSATGGKTPEQRVAETATKEAEGPRKTAGVTTYPHTCSPGLFGPSADFDAAEGMRRLNIAL